MKRLIVIMAVALAMSGCITGLQVETEEGSLSVTEKTVDVSVDRDLMEDN